jgi:hypothetical protein
LVCLFPASIFAAARGRALDFLAKRIEEIDEPYLIASYALAAMDSGEKSRVEKAVAKLRTLAREEAGTSYWNLESNTPFYGWGLERRAELKSSSTESASLRSRCRWAGA